MTIPVSGATGSAADGKRPGVQADGSHGASAGGATATRPSASVVICAYTAVRLTVLQSAASAVREQLRDGDELLVVVDHNEQLLETLVSALVPDGESVRVLVNDNPPGLSGARNAGIAEARGELVVFLDDDAVPRPGWLAQLIRAFAEPSVIGAGGVAAARWETRRPAWLPEEFLWVVGCSYRGLSQAPAEIRNPIGANMAFRRSVIRQAGGFTDGLGRIGRVPLGCEETELSIRATRASGGRILQQPTAVVDHLVTTERMRVGYFLRRCWAEGISKAFVTMLAGSDAALASERRYTTRTLPAGLLVGLRDGLGGDRSGFGRAAAILVGLAVTAAGFVRGSVTARAARTGRPRHGHA